MVCQYNPLSRGLCKDRMPRATRGCFQPIRCATLHGNMDYAESYPKLPRHLLAEGCPVIGISAESVMNMQSTQTHCMFGCESMQKNDGVNPARQADQQTIPGMYMAPQAGRERRRHGRGASVAMRQFP